MKSPYFPTISALALIAAFGLSHAQAADSAAGINKTIDVILKNPQGENIGEAHLSSVSGGVRFVIKASHLTPGKHGFHVHEKASCEGPGFKSAGGHFNPEHKEHGTANPKGPHAGDMPSLDVKRSGTVKADFVAHGVTLGEGVDSLERPEGLALVIHAKDDDQKTNPSGDSGDRVACGVIPVSAPAAAK